MIVKEEFIFFFCCVLAQHLGSLFRKIKSILCQFPANNIEFGKFGVQLLNMIVLKTNKSCVFNSRYKFIAWFLGKITHPGSNNKTFIHQTGGYIFSLNNIIRSGKAFYYHTSSIAYLSFL